MEQMEMFYLLTIREFKNKRKYIKCINNFIENTNDFILLSYSLF